MQWLYCLSQARRQLSFQGDCPEGGRRSLPLPEGDFTSCGRVERPYPLRQRSCPSSTPATSCSLLKVGGVCEISVICASRGGCAAFFSIDRTVPLNRVVPHGHPTPDATPLWDDVMLRGLCRTESLRPLSLRRPGPAHSAGCGAGGGGGNIAAAAKGGGCARGARSYGPLVLLPAPRSRGRCS